VVAGVVFDCFGVIRVDPTYIAYRKLGGDVDIDKDFIERVMDVSCTGAISATPLFAEKLGVSPEIWLKTSQQVSSLDHELLAYIKTLRPYYKTALLSNIGKGGLARWFEPGVLEQYFDVAVASGDIGHIKPEPEAYQVVAKRLGIPTEQCVMIDDRPDYCAGARTVGLQAIEYRSLEQLQRELRALGVSAG
jgi:HAD superfamily hydrolase (TIGR01509 family)